MKEKKQRMFSDPDHAEVDMVKSVPDNVYVSKEYTRLGYDKRLYNFELRKDDVWIVTYPKCGTTWTQVRLNQTTG